MREVFICDAVRTPIGRYGGALASVRADDLAAVPIRALRERQPQVDWARLDDVVLGWRFVNPSMRDAFGVDSMPETAENVADEHGVSRSDQDAFAERSQPVTAGNAPGVNDGACALLLAPAQAVELLIERV